MTSLALTNAGGYSLQIIAPGDKQNYYSMKGAPLALTASGTPVSGLYWVQDSYNLTGGATTVFISKDIFADYKLSATNVVYGNYHVGTTLLTNITLWNIGITTTNNVTEGLRTTATSTNGQATINGLYTGILADQATTNFSFGMNSLAGTNTGSVALSFTSVTNGTSLTSASVGTGTLRNGYGGATNIATKTITISGVGYRYAVATASTNLNLGNIHVGDTFGTQSLLVSNAAAADIYSEKLDASFGTPTGGVTTNGTVSLLAAGATSGAMTVSLSDNTAGAKSGSVNLLLTSDGTGTSGLGNTALATQTVTVTGAVFRYAGATVTSTNINLGNIHVGGTFGTQSLLVSNTAVADAYSEKLDASFGTPTGGVTTNGTVSLLAAGATSSGMTVSLSDNTAGAKSGTVTVNLTSDGSGTSGLGLTGLTGKTITVTGAVFRLAAPVLTTTVNLGNIHEGDSFGTQALTIGNTATADSYSEKLDANFGALTGGASTNNGTISLLGPGASNVTSLVVGLDNASTATAGAKTGTAVVNLTSDGTGTSGLGNTTLTPQTVTINGAVYRLAAPEVSSTLTLATIHAGGTFGTTNVTLVNNAATDGYSEKLTAGFGALTGVSGSGSISQLDPGATNNTGMSVSLTDNTAGQKSGTAVVNLTSDGSGTSGLGTTTLPNQTLTLNGSVFSGYATWTGFGGSYGTAANWTDDVTPAIKAVPGTFSGFDNVDKASFSGSGGTVNLDGVSPSLSNLVFGGSSAYTLAQGTGGSVTLKGSGAAIDVTGTATHEISAPLALANAVDVNTAFGSTLRLGSTVSGAYTITKNGLGTLDIAGTVAGGIAVDAGTLAGTGQIGGATTINSGGTLAPGAAGGGIGTLTFSTDLTLAIGATTVLDLASASSYDRIVLSGDLMSGGTLVVTNLTGFTLTKGNSFDLLDFNTNLGSFVTVVLPDLLNPTLSWDTSRFASEGVLTVIPEPSAVTLVGAGLLMMLVITRRRRTTSR